MRTDPSTIDTSKTVYTITIANATLPDIVHAMDRAGVEAGTLVQTFGVWRGVVEPGWRIELGVMPWKSVNRLLAVLAEVCPDEEAVWLTKGTVAWQGEAWLSEWRNEEAR